MIISRRLWKSIQQGLLAAATVVVFVTLGLVLAALLPSYLGYESLIVYGGSMAPFLRLGDVAVMQPIKPQYLRVGDVATYRSPSDPRVLVTHRIIRIEAQDGVLAFETKGDASPNVDYWSVTGDKVVGKVVYKVPFVGYVFDFAKALPGRLLLVGLPALLLVIETSRGKHTVPCLDDRPTSRLDEEVQDIRITPEATQVDTPAAMVHQPGLLAASCGVVVQAKAVDQVRQAILSSTGDRRKPLLSNSWPDCPLPSWLHRVELHPIKEKPMRLWVLGRLFSAQ